MSNWKLDENGNIVMRDGNPVYVNTNGDEQSVAVDTISRLNNEAKTHREAKEAALEKLKAFEGLDAAKAREALETVAKLDANKLIDAGKVDEVKSQITAQLQGQIDEKTKALTDLQAKYDNMIVNNLFANSEFIRNNVAVPRDMFEAKFRGNFKVENGQVVVYGNDGNRLYSKERAGEYATPEEGLRILAEAHPNRDTILKANTGTGTGSNGASGSSGGSRYMKRADFEKLSPAKQVEYAQKMRNGEITLTD